jgi:UDP-GlcNAc:undecaprenyl-phosphate GlcNAc-1-phosphate transferase
MKSLLLLCCYSFVITFLLTPLVSAAFRRLQVVDHPDDGRKLHAKAVPRVGGIPLAIGYFVSLGLLYLISGADLPVPRSNVLLFIKVLPAAGIVFWTGLLDDLVGLKPSHKLIGQFAGAIWVYYVGVRIMGTEGFPHWVSLPLTLLWLVGCTNAFNLIDGLDGLAAGIGLLATLTIVIAALMHNNLALAIITVPLAGSLMGFLKYNFNPASIFLGDCGSLLVGFLLGCFAVIWSQKAVTLLGMTAPLMAVAIPVLDIGLSIIRRYLRRQPLFLGDRGHIHHRLLAMGLGPREVAIVLYGAGGLAAAFSLLQSVAYRRFGGLVVVLFCTIAWAGVQRLRYVELDILRRMLLGGEFRSILTSRIRLQLFEDALASAKTADECWLLIREACREFGFFQVALKVGGISYKQRFGPTEMLPGWNAHVEFSESDYVDILTPFRSAQTGAVGPLLDVLRTQIQSKDLSHSRHNDDVGLPEVLQVRRAEVG